MLRTAVLVVLLSVSLLTSGCFGGSETDEVTYVIAIGIDKAEDNKIRATYQIAVPHALGGGEGGKGGGKEAVEIVTIQAENLAEARSLLNSVVSRKIMLSHVRAFIFGEEYARKGMRDFMAVAMRFREFRGTMYIAVVNNGTAEEFIKENKPRLETLPSKYFQNQVSTAANSGYFLTSTIHDFYRKMKTNRGSPYAMLFGLNKQTGQGKIEGARLKGGESTDDYSAGNIPRTGEANPSEILGTAVFVSDKMVGILTGQESRMISILQGEFGQGYLVVSDPLVPDKKLNVHLRLGRSPKIKCMIEQGQIKITADVLLEGEITNIPSGVNYESPKYSHLVEQQVNQLIEQEMSSTLRKTQDMGSDVAGFGAYAAKQFNTYNEYSKFNFERRYPQAQITLSIKTAIRRTGLMWQTTPIP